MADLLIIVPSRSRPQNVERLLAAWTATGAWGVADLLVAVDADDPALPGYLTIDLPAGARMTVAYVWRPMVHKLNHEAAREAGAYFALGFMGDDHEPITEGWADRYVDALRTLGTGVVSCPDGLRTDRLPTQWAMTSDIVESLGRMVPAPVEHLYCDDAIRSLATAADCYAYLDGSDGAEPVMVRHNHYLAGRAPSDEQYQQVNSRDQYDRDRPAYQRWVRERLEADAAAVRTLRGVVEPLWTILVPTLGQRRDLFARLLDRIMPQVEAADGAVRVLAYWNNGEVSLPEIRQRMVEAVTTPYLSFVDDDDLVAEDFVPAILEALASRPDFVGFNVQCYTDGQPQGIASHALRNRRWFETPHSPDASGATLFRDISHLNPMRTTAAMRVSFRVAGRGQAEDRAWVRRLRDMRLLRTEVVIERVLYHYLWTSDGTAWQSRHLHRITADGWEPLPVDSPHFAYHPACAAAKVAA